MTEIAIHFGVYPTHGVLDVAGHSDATEEYPIGVGAFDAYVSGSWKCWGPADQDTDGDDSLHVLVLPEQPLSHALARSLYEGVRDLTNGRLLPYAWISTAEDWSEITHIATFAGGDTSVYEIGKRIPA